MHRQRTFLGHPLGLYVLFFTEMWERFSYYGMRALLILYMVNYFKWAQKDASFIYKWYTSLVYLTPLIGGYLADRYLGNKRAVIIGAILMAIGHFLMAFEAITVFYGALIFLIIGNGFFKPNMSTQVGRLYPRNDPRRDGAYTIFYMGINLGAFLSPIACGWLAENTVGRYHSGFTLAGIGMVCGLLIYVFGLPLVKEIDTLAEPQSDFARAVRDLQKQTEQAPGEAFVAMVHLAALPPGCDLKRAGFPEDEVRYDADSQTLVATRKLSPADVDRLLDCERGDSEAIQSASPRISVPLSEEAAERTPSASPLINRLAPMLFVVAGIAGCLWAPVAAWRAADLFSGILAFAFYAITATCSFVLAWVLANVHHASRDRVLTIFVLGIFVVCFWAAFEQAGNVLNLWADKATDRQLGGGMPAPAIHPHVADEGLEESDEEPSFWDRWQNMFRLLPRNDAEADGNRGAFVVPTTWFQSINALAIFVLAPVFAWMWVALDRRGWNPSIPTKMALGVLLMGLSLAVMVGAARQEDQETRVQLAGASLPPGVGVNADGQLCPVNPKTGELEKPFFSGRLRYDPAGPGLHITGVFPDLERDRVVRATAPPAYVKQVDELQKAADQASGRRIRASVTLDPVPPGFDLKYAGLPDAVVEFDPQTRTLTAKRKLADKDIKGLLVAGGEPKLRDTLNQLMVQSSQFRVSMQWLFWSYILATLGELCLSPVGLSMVSKLAPARFATMLMGLWLVTSFFGNFVAGAMGEIWEEVTPSSYFLIFVTGLGIASLLLFLLVRKIVAMMHGVN